MSNKLNCMACNDNVKEGTAWFVCSTCGEAAKKNNLEPKLIPGVAPRHPSYVELAAVLDQAVERAVGKGETRHGLSEELFEDQDGFKVRSLVGDGFTLGQAIKKISEAKGLGYGSERDVELLDAIVYLAMEIIAGRQRGGGV